MRCGAYLSPHRWTHLLPSDAQIETLARLLECGRAHAAAFIAARADDVADRICSRCFDAEARLDLFLAALVPLRGAGGG